MSIVTEAREQLLMRVRELTQRLIPQSARVLVVAKVDPALYEAAGNADPFPQGSDGQHAGAYPADTDQAIEHLTDLRKKGATHLLFPSTSFWWLDHYEGFRRHLGLEHECLWRDDCCVLYQLAPIDTTPVSQPTQGEADFWRRTAEQRRRRIEELEQTVSAITRRMELHLNVLANDSSVDSQVPDAPPLDLAKIIQFREISPIFVLGASRSGTTAMGDAIKQALNCFAWHEGHLFHQLPAMLVTMKKTWDALQKFEHAASGLWAADHFDHYELLNSAVRTFNQLYADATKSAGATRWLDKTPEVGTITTAPLLHHIYPNATFIYMHRHPIKRAVSFLKKFRDYPEATPQIAIISWKAAMDAWAQVRQMLPADRWREFRQEDLQLRTDEVVASLTTLLELTPGQADTAREFFRNERPESTGSSNDSDELLLDNVAWPDDFKSWCRSTCESTASAWGYRLVRS